MRLNRLETLSPAAREFDVEFNALRATAEQRERAGLKAKNSIEKFRARTLLYHLQRLRRLPGEWATEPDVVLDWLPFEAWYATRALRPGMYRVVTSVAALDDTPQLDPERTAWALRLYDEERLKLDLDLSLRIAVGLYRRDPTAPNVERLARVRLWRGDGDAALGVLGEAIAAHDDTASLAQLHTARARTADALALRRTALSDYGAALAFASVEAARDLCASALLAGERAKTRFLADVVLRSAPGDEEALIQRALAQLPAPEPLEERTTGASENATLGADTPTRRNPATSEY